MSAPASTLGDEKNHATPSNIGSPQSSITDLEKTGLDTPTINDEAGDAQTPEAPADHYPHGFKLASIMFGIYMCFVIVALDSTIIATAIPKITDEFHGLDKVAWYSSAYLVTFGGLQSPWGKIYKFVSAKWSLLVSIFIFEVGSLLCALAPNATALIVGRAIQGIGGAGIVTGAYTVVAYITAPARRPAFMGILGSAYGVGAVLGPLIGGAFTSKATWRWCFWINLPLGAVGAALLVIFFQMPDEIQLVQATLKEKILQTDPLGAAIVMGALISFILAFEYGGQTAPWSSSLVIGLIVGVFVIFAAFVAWELYQGERAMIPPRLMAQHSVWQACMFQFFIAGAYFILIYFLPVYFQSIDNATPLGSGVRNIPLIIAATFGTIAAGITLGATGRGQAIMIFGSSLGLIGCGLTYTLDIGTSTGKWIGYQILAGVGMGIPFQVGITVAQAKAQPEDISSVTAIIFFFQTIGGSWSIAAAQSGFVNRIISTIARTAPEINPLTVIATGATELRKAFTPEQVPAVVGAYMAGLKVAFIVLIAVSAGSVAASALASPEKLDPEGLKELGAVAG